jgi:type II secretory pathway pseudopilin PulG
MLGLKRRQSGDTIIEVLMAVTVFSMVAVLSITIMNQSANSAQRALELTLVRQQIDMQVEALRAVHQAYVYKDDTERSGSIWQAILNAPESSINTSGGCPEDIAAYKDTFFLWPTSAVMSTDFKPISEVGAPLYAQVLTNGDEAVSYGLWIEKKKITKVGDPAIPDAFDFRIRACWQSVGVGDKPMQIETVVRLYDVS